MTMPVKINFIRHATEARLMGAFNKGLPLLASEIRADCNEYCKMDAGGLIASSLIHSRLEAGEIVWQTPYAKRQYWEIRTAYKKEGHPKATWKWAEVAKRRNLAKWQRQAQRLLEMNL